MDWPILRGMIRRNRRRRALSLIKEIEAWEQQGRDLLAALLEITDDTDDLASEARRLINALDR